MNCLFLHSREIKSENISLEQLNQYNRKRSRMANHRDYFKHEDNYDEGEHYENNHSIENIKHEKSSSHYIDEDEKFEEPPEDLTKPK